MVFGKDINVQHMAETIRANDPFCQCAESIRQGLLEYNFDLQDRFCYMNYLKTAWDSIKIPEPLFRFFSILYNFDAESFASPCQVVVWGMMQRRQAKQSLMCRHRNADKCWHFPNHVL